MKKSILSLLLSVSVIFSAFSSDYKKEEVKKPHKSPSKDTIIIKLKNKNKVMVVTDQSSDLSDVKSYNINKLLADLDSTLKANESTILITDEEGRLKLRDTTLRISTFRRGRHSKAISIIIDKNRGSDTVHISRQGRDRHRGRGRRSHRMNDEIELDFGFNNYLENGKMPDTEGKNYGLNPLKSNQIAIRYQNYLRIGGEKSSVFFNFGAEIAWNNYRFEDKVIIKKGQNAVEFVSPGSDIALSKSKLTISWLNVPVGFNFQVGKRWDISTQVFAGYRLSSHSKIKYSQGNDTKKDKDFSNFYLNNLQYGYRLKIKYDDFGAFFQYQANELFNKGPKLTPVSFGVTFGL